MKGEKGENGTQGLPGDTVSSYNSNFICMYIHIYVGLHWANGP